MRRWLAVLVALALAMPAAAQDDKPAWVGVWEGTVGNLPVMACLSTWGGGQGHGSYYYLSQLEPIALSQGDGAIGWTESEGSGEAAEWNFTELSATALRGNWRQKRRLLPFALHPVAWTEGEWEEGPCASEAFLAPRVGGGTIVSAAADFRGWRYTTRTYRPAARFADDATIDSFAFPAEQPGDAAINDSLATFLPKEVVGDDFLQCMASTIASTGHDGGFEETVIPAMVAPAFLVAMRSSSSFCGGAHPDAYYQYLTFDRQSGRQLDLFDWLGPAAVEHHSAEGESADYDTVRPALRRLILAREPGDDLALFEDPADEPSADDEPYPEECREAVEDEEFWTLGLSRNGMMFTPVVPHVINPCAETFTVPWDALAPFLNDAGRAGLARLRAG